MFPELYAVVLLAFLPSVRAQTEGDPGYDYGTYGGAYEDAVIGFDPNFDSPVANVTVVKLQTVILPCSIEYLGSHKVVWIDSSSIPITYEERRIIDDSRFSIVRPIPREWNLQIREVRREDEGQYRCTINTNPVKSKEITLRVKVPATIIDEFSSGNVTSVEGEQVSLVCNATGAPMPHVTWSVRSNKVSLVRSRKACKFKTTNGAGAFGSTLIIPNVTRHCHDIFECTANNGIPPVSSRQMKLTVEFAPQVHMPTNRILQDLGRETILECTITAFPHAVNYWERNGHRVSSSMKHRIEAYKEGDQVVILSLKIVITDHSDFGEYKCKAANWLGRDEKSMHLLETTKMRTTLRHPKTTDGRASTKGLVSKESVEALPINLFRLEKQLGNIMYRSNGISCVLLSTWLVLIQTLMLSIDLTQK